MVDIHAHILPGLDDGARTMEEALEMAYIAYQSGVEIIVATSHFLPSYFDYSRKLYEKQLTSFQQALDENIIPVMILPGMELFGFDDLIDVLLEGEVNTINHTPFVLVEFDFEDDIDRVNQVLYRLKQGKYEPVIAHPERYIFVQEDYSILEDWVNEGYLLQMNQGSIFGDFGRNAKRVADFMIANELVYVIGSDAHGLGRRNTNMGHIYSYLCDNYSISYANQILYDNSRKIVNYIKTV